MYVYMYDVCNDINRIMIIFNITNYHSNRHNLLKTFNHNLNTVFLKELGHCIQSCHLSLRFFSENLRGLLFEVFV